jgi:hypothetical protein
MEQCLGISEVVSLVGYFQIPMTEIDLAELQSKPSGRRRRPLPDLSLAIIVRRSGAITQRNMGPSPANAVIHSPFSTSLHPRRVISRSGDSSLAIGGDLHGIDQLRMILHQLVYSLIPPEVRPLITYFWHTRKTTVIGTPPNTASAENRPQSFSCS